VASEQPADASTARTARWPGTGPGDPPRRALLPPTLRRDPAFAIECPAWDTFARWEWNAERCVGYLGDRDWDHAWVREGYSSDDEDEAFEEDEDDEEVDKDEDNDLDFSFLVVTSRHSLRLPRTGRKLRHLRPRLRGKGHPRRHEDFVANATYNVLLARENGEHYVMPPELTEDEELSMAVLVSTEEEKRAFPRLEDALAFSVVPSHPPQRQPPPSPPRRVPRPGHATVHEPWDPWPKADPPAISWLPPPPPPPQGPPPSPMASWPWPQGPFVDLTLDEDNDDGLA
jgi:hypothetical protein